MVDISSQNNKINITVSSSGNTANTNITPDYAQYYSEKSKEWAISNKIVDNTDYSSKYYANESKKQADISTAKTTEVVESGNAAVSNIESARDNAIINVNTAGATQVALATEQATIATNKASEVVESGNNALANIDTAKNNAITSITNQETTSRTSLIDEGATQVGLIQNEGATQIANVQSTGFYMRDNKLYFINSQGEETEFKSGGSSLEVMYDKDNKAIKFIDSTNTIEFIINPEPSDATVVITSGTCEQVGNSIIVPKNSLVEYTVSKDGMATKSGYLNVVEDTSIDVKLTLHPVSLTIKNTVLYSDTTLTYNDGSGNTQTATVNGDESVTINVVPNTIIKATASSLGKGTYFILTNTSGSIDYTPWAAGGAGGGAWAYCCNSIKTVNSTDSISLTYNDTLTGGSNTITGTGSASNISDDYGISTPISITTTSSTNTYIFNYNPSPTETYSFGGVFALIDTNGVGSVVGSSSSGGGGMGGGTIPDPEF